MKAPPRGGAFNEASREGVESVEGAASSDELRDALSAGTQFEQQLTGLPTDEARGVLPELDVPHRDASRRTRYAPPDIGVILLHLPEQLEPQPAADALCAPDSALVPDPVGCRSCEL